ncbi:peptidase S9B family protein [Abortiporus biennis]
MTTPTYSPLSQNGQPAYEEDDEQTLHVADETVKPEVYYGEGPFDPPSSDEEEDIDVTDKSPLHPGMRSPIDRESLSGRTRRPSSLRCLIFCLAGLVSIAALIGLFAAFSYTGTSYQIRGTKHITMDHVFNGTFWAEKQSLRWVPEAGDGVFAVQQEQKIILVDLKTNTTKDLVNLPDLVDGRGFPLSMSSWELSSDMKFMLIETDHTKQWRHSSFGNYYVHDFEKQTTFPLIPPSNPPTIALAKWSPSGQSIAFVTKNDLYILESPSPTAAPVRITATGNSSVFNGITDWVYEEEVFSSPSALWWSPNSSKLAFLSFDETAVDIYTYPIYNPTSDAHSVIPYPDHVAMKYPKPGYNNPLVSVHVFEMDRFQASVQNDHTNVTLAAQTATLQLNWENRMPLNDSIIAEIAWVGNTTLLLKEVNRAAVDGHVVLFEVSGGPASQGHVVRKLGKNGEQADSGWIDSAQAIHTLPSSLWPSGSPAYLDITPSPEGFNHIALFSPATSSKPLFLTLGKWEVTGKILGVDAKDRLVYFQAANPSSIERHIYSVAIPKAGEQKVEKPKPLTPAHVASSYSASFSPQSGFYLLNYDGPQPPWQKILQVGKPEFSYVLTTNKDLNDTIAQFELPFITRSTIESDGFELNYLEIRPPRMDDSGKKKYPVLFRVYGGPFSQLVDLKYQIDWHYYVACYLEYVVVIVDGRGTGYKGRKLRNPVKDNLGHWETRDQINAAKIWAAKEYVDRTRIGIWGWSYGGFMSSKVVEANAGIHSLAMAVAPVTSWRLYDSIYTERYMNIPEVNPGGYVTASISNVTAFHNVDFLLAHGSGDDNVHYANSAHLLDMFTQEKVRNFRFRMFTDSDHSISKRGGYRELYEFLTEFLIEKWGRGGHQRGW